MALKYTWPSVAAIVALDLVGSATQFVLPILGQIGVGLLAAIVVFFLEFYAAKGIKASLVLAVLAAVIIAIPGPTGVVALVALGIIQYGKLPDVG